MISTTLMIWLGIGSAAIVIALVLWRPRRRLSANTEAELAHARNASFAGMLLSFAASIGFARAQAGHSDGYSWHGSHLHHGHHGHGDGGSYSDGGGYGGGDTGGGGI
jgi:hypothetical protein